MKKLLLAFLILLSSLCCHAQDEEIVKPLQKTDTVPCIMLVCDTSTYREGNFNRRNVAAFYINGFDVRDKHNANERSNGDWSCWNCPDYMEHSYYLNADKKPLSKYILVWQSTSTK